MKRFLVFLVFIGILGLIVYDSVLAVPDGYIGVATYRIGRLGAISTAPRKLDSGLHLSLPFLTRLHLYSDRVQMLTLQVPVGGGKIFQMTTQVRLDPDSAVAVHLKHGPRYLEDKVKPWLTELMKNKIYETHGNMNTVQQQDLLESAVREDLSLDGLHLERAFLTRLEHLELVNDQPATAEESDTDEDEE